MVRLADLTRLDFLAACAFGAYALAVALVPALWPLHEFASPSAAGSMAAAAAVRWALAVQPPKGLA